MKRINKLFGSSLRMKALVFYLAFAMASITCIPSMGTAGTVPTQNTVNATAAQSYDREADMALIRAALGSQAGKIAMTRVGVTQQKMETNLSNLSDAQLRLVSEKLRASLPAGGDVEIVIWGVGGLVLVIIVVVVIILILSNSSMAGRY